MPYLLRQSVFFCLVFWAILSSARAQSVSSTERLSFNRQVRPILSNHCFQCHGPDEESRATDLRLDLKASAMGDLGGYRAVVPGHVDQSELISRIQHIDPDQKMPPIDSGKRLTDREIQTLTQWIEQGAEWPEFWAYQPFPKHPAPSTEADSGWGNGWIDAWVLRGLARQGLQPSRRTDPTTLIRRLHFDLTGLPPNPEQVRAFLKNPSEETYQQVVDQLLASPHYGERMAMYWLDLVRYADTVGYHGDQDHNIAPYRSWVIDAFNRNMPFDQFTQEQLAGDLLPDPTLQQQIATGYNRLLQTTHEGGLQPKEYRAIYAADRVRNVSSVWMGGTLGCAQCHDHKYDPYTSKDFYAMSAFFADIDDEQHFKVGTNALPTRRPPELLVIGKKDRRILDELSAKVRSAEQERKSLEAKAKTLEGNDRDAAQQELDSLNAQIKSWQDELRKTESRGQWTMVTRALSKPRISRVLPRGNWLDETGPEVQPAVPEFLESIELDRRANRLDLAEWLTNTEQLSGKLTARVLANRIWFLLMGSGVSPSLDDFGGQGKPPANPELLDNLAWELIENNWDIKELIRKIVTSETYRQSSITSAQQREKDPYNQLFGRQDRYRLPAETVRDTVLSVSGLLNLQEIGGRSAKPFQPEGYYQHLNFPARKYQPHVDQRQWRRGLYIHWQRQFLHPTLKSLDAPSREECTAERPRSNTPLAALALLNDPSFLAAAQVFAQRILTETKGDIRTGVEYAFEAATSRQPDEDEARILEQLFRQSLLEYQSDPTAVKNLLSRSLIQPPETADDAELAAWVTVARALLNLDETITRN